MNTSFSSRVKQELCRKPFENACCASAELYGLLLFCHTFNRKEIRLHTENRAVACHFTRALKTEAGIEAAVAGGGAEAPSVMYSVFVGNEQDIRRLYLKYNIGLDSPTVSLDPRMAGKRCCFGAFVRGAFLSCGYVADPYKRYYLDFDVPRLRLGRDFYEFLAENGVSGRFQQGANGAKIYFKESGQIEDVLALMGAVKSSLELMNVKIYKDIRNNANRVTNCETANIGKIVETSAAQSEAIMALKESGELDKLPGPLKEIAIARIKHPELSLAELGMILEPPIGKSGASHRMRKIMEYASQKTRGRRHA